MLPVFFDHEHFCYIRNVSNNSNWQESSSTHSNPTNCSSESMFSSSSTSTHTENPDLPLFTDDSTQRFSDASLEINFNDVRLNIDDLIKLKISNDDSRDNSPALCSAPVRRVRQRVSKSSPSWSDSIQKFDFRSNKENHENAKLSLNNRLNRVSQNSDNEQYNDISLMNKRKHNQSFTSAFSPPSASFTCGMTHELFIRACLIAKFPVTKHEFIPISNQDTNTNNLTMQELSPIPVVTVVTSTDLN